MRNPQTANDNNQSRSWSFLFMRPFLRPVGSKILDVERSSKRFFIERIFISFFI